MNRATCKFLLVMLVLLTPGCGAANWTGPPPLPSPDTVEARKFVLVDAAGNPLAELGAAHGGSGLVLLDSAGKPRVRYTIPPARTAPPWQPPPTALRILCCSTTMARLWPPFVPPQSAKLPDIRPNVRKIRANRKASDICEQPPSQFREFFTNSPSLF